MKKKPSPPKDLYESIQKVAVMVSKWPQWKRGGSAAAARPAAPRGKISRKKQVV